MTLTREEILAMEPGRKLDALIKEYIFKVDLSGFEWARVGNSMFKNTDDAVTWIDIPNYSLNISAAWEVVEKMRQNKIYLDIRVWPDEYQVLPHQDENNKLIDRWIVKRSSLPEAICKAALLAVLNL